MADQGAPSGAFSANAASTSTSLPTAPPQKAVQALAHYTIKDTSKVMVRFKAIGSAPIMKNNAFRITAFNRFQAVIVFLKKELGNSAGGSSGSLVSGRVPEWWSDLSERLADTSIWNPFEHAGSFSTSTTPFRPRRMIPLEISSG